MNPANPDDAFNGELSRRRFLRHAAWAGAAVAVTVSGGVVTSNVLHHGSSTPKAEDFSFVQISDSHIGFTGAANPDVTKTFQSALDLVNALPARPDFVVEESEPWHEDGQKWRPLVVTYPDTIVAHCRQQTYYFDDGGLLRRLDYSADILGGGPAVHYPSDYRQFDGIMVPTRRRVYVRNPDGSRQRDSVAVAIDVADVRFA